MPFGLITTRKARRIAVEAVSRELSHLEELHRVMPATSDRQKWGDAGRVTALRRVRIVVQDAFASKAEIRASK